MAGCNTLFSLLIAGFLIFNTQQARAALSESLDCSAIEGFYHDTLTRWNDADGFIKSSERYGISNSPWQLTVDDIAAFQARLLQCKAQGQLTRELHEDMLGEAMTNFKNRIAESVQHAKMLGTQAAKNEEFVSRLSALENAMQSGMTSYADAAQQFKSIVDEIYDFRRKGDNSYFSKHYSNQLIARAEAGLTQAQSADGAAKTAGIENLLTDLEKDVTDAAHNINTLFERFFKLSQQSRVDLDGISGTYQVKADELRDRVENVREKLISRFNSEILDYIKQEIQKINTAISGYTTIEHLNSIASDYQKIDAIRSDINELIRNPGMQGIIRIELEARDALDSISGSLSSVKDNICTAAAREQCIANLPDFPEEYRDTMVGAGGGITILDLACAAKNSGHYNGFSTGGIFSNDIILRLETGEIYFKEQRYSAETRQAVGSNYTGDTITMLIATMMESNGKKQDIQISPLEMRMLYSRMGGVPNVKECQQ